MNKVIIFDYDDTIVRAKEHHLVILRQLYEQKFIDLEPQLVEKLPISIEGLYKFLSEHKCENGGYEDFKSKFNNLEPDKTDVFPWIPNLLDNLKREQYDMVICSYNDLHKIERNLERQNLKQYFKFIFTPTTGFSKKNSNIFNHLKKEYQSAVFKSVLIGDSSSDLKLANNSGIEYLDVKDIEGLTDQERLSIILSAVTEISVHDLTSTLEDNLLVAQYNSLRAELLNHQEVEEKTYSTTLLVTGTIFSAMLTIIFTNDVKIYTGLAFVFPAFYTLTSLSKYLTNSLRVTNISSFIGVKYSPFFPHDINWELKIGEFSSNSEVKKSVNLNSSFETAFVYRIIIVVAILLSMIVSFISFGKHFIKYAITHFSFEYEFLSFRYLLLEISRNPYPYLSLLDLIGVICANILVAYLYFKKINDSKKKMKYSEKKKLLTELWTDLP